MFQEAAFIKAEDVKFAKKRKFRNKLEDYNNNNNLYNLFLDKADLMFQLWSGLSV